MFCGDGVESVGVAGSLLHLYVCVWGGGDGNGHGVHGCMWGGWKGMCVHVCCVFCSIPVTGVYVMM